MLSDQREDLDKAIIHFALLLPPDSWLLHGRLSIRAALFLALALIKRAVLSKQPKDAVRAAKYLRDLRGHPQKAPGISLHEVKGLLVEALAFQVKSETGTAMQDIEEMSILCDELLTSNHPIDLPFPPLFIIPTQFFTNSVCGTRICHWIKSLGACNWQGCANQNCALLTSSLPYVSPLAFS